MPNHSDDESFEQVGAGASLSIPKQCSALRKNEYVLLKGNPCKIVEMSTSKTGKHGHAKVRQSSSAFILHNILNDNNNLYLYNTY